MQLNCLDDTCNNDSLFVPIKIDSPNFYSKKLIEEYLQIRSKEKSQLLDFSQSLEKLEMIASEYPVSCPLELALYAIDLFPLIIFNHYPTITELYWNGGMFGITDRIMGRKKIIFDPRINTSRFYESLKIQLELVTNEILNSKNASLIGNLNSNIGRLRVSMKHPPFGKSIVIRRLPTNPIPIDILIKENQICLRYADFLKNAILERKNIIIAGEPGSGKTTLLNALLLLIPSAWRVVVLEDTNEITLSGVFVDKLSIPQIRFANISLSAKKENAIAFVLRNSPDYLVFGEIQQKQDTLRVFEALSSGLRGIVTIHAKDFNTLMMRLCDSHNLSQELLSQIDVLVITKREIDHAGHIKLSVPEIYSQKNGVLVKMD